MWSLEPGLRIGTLFCFVQGTLSRLAEIGKSLQYVKGLKWWMNLGRVKFLLHQQNYFFVICACYGTWCLKSGEMPVFHFSHFPNFNFTGVYIMLLSETRKRKKNLQKFLLPLMFCNTHRHLERLGLHIHVQLFVGAFPSKDISKCNFHIGGKLHGYHLKVLSSKRFPDFFITINWILIL